MIHKYFELPQAVLLNKKLTKKIITEGNKLSANDKKLLNSINSINIYGVLTSENYTILPLINTQEDYSELLFLNVDLKTKIAPSKINTFLQKLMPRPLIIVFSFQGENAFGYALKNINQVDITKRTITEMEVTRWIDATQIEQNHPKFRDDLNIALYTHTNLKEFYLSFVKRVQLLRIAIAENTSYEFLDTLQLENKRQNQREKENLEAEISTLRSQLKQTQSFGNQVALNQHIQGLKLEIKQLEIG
ncbi:MAG: DUF4391 domain-containing protein [Flavobacteriaceae bacterium]|nr:DUF4391 domain-containing protein [Flavobacteriaceae bacterium]